MDQLKGVFIVIIATLFTTLSQYLFKLGAASFDLSISGIINPYIIPGFLSYAIAAVLFILALKRGELSVLYPIWSLSFVWISIMSLIFLNEIITITNWLGIFFIVFGISLLSIGARND